MKALIWLDRITQKQWQHLTMTELTRYINAYRIDGIKPIAFGSFKVLKSALARIGKPIGDYDFAVLPTEPVSFRTKINHTALVYAIKKAISLVNLKSTQVCFDTGLMVLLCLATGLRTSEITQLTVNQLDCLLQGKDIFIRIKKKLHRPKILIIKDLIMTKLSFIKARRKARLITSGASSCLHKFKQLINEVSTVPVTRPLGMQAIRSFVTTFITQRGGLPLAQLFNRHEDKATTAKHYVMHDTR